ncbi:MAG: NADH:ubiquinone reductase (Na(+)-transporting) subunit F [Bacteroidales bacterium]|nr:NADH:ubiquinone reductase (Na(+)-transporting) subunit F [Bacteroidales bacterium]
MILLSTASTTIIAAVAGFLILILILVGILLFAKSKLLPSGNVKLTINEEKEYSVSAGTNLLGTLAAEKIFIPSACGGQGTCGMCRLQITDGGGEILPTEVGFFSRKEQQNHWRLACQVKVKEEMKIEIEEEILGVKKWECEVISNHNVATFIKEFVVRLPEGENLNFKSGGYIQIDVPKFSADFKDMDIEEEYRDEWDKFKMWDLSIDNKEETFRAYSMANHPAEGNIVMLNIRIATPPWDRSANTWKKGIPPGICSSFIFSRKPGDKVTVSGPYGEFFLRKTNNEKMFIGGGAGMAPMRSHLFHLFHTEQNKDLNVTFWYGARSRREIFYEEDFDDIKEKFSNFDYTIALSEPLEADKWEGKTGFIHQVIFDEYLSKHEEPEDIEYYLCGPPMMIDAVKKMLYDLGVPDENVMFDDFGS